MLKAYRFRILAGCLFCVFLISTWFLFYQKPKYPEELHISLQEQLKVIVRKTLSDKHPKMRNFKFQKMWTQATNRKDQISAHFEYSFKDESQTRFSIKGQALMNRKDLHSSDKYDLWTLDHVQINNTKLDFQEPVILFSSKYINEPDSHQEVEDSHIEEKVEALEEKVEALEEKSEPVKEKVDNTASKQQTGDLQEEAGTEAEKKKSELQNDNEKKVEVLEEKSEPVKEKMEPVKEKMDNTASKQQTDDLQEEAGTEAEKKKPELQNDNEENSTGPADSEAVKGGPVNENESKPETTIEDKSRQGTTEE